MTDLDGISGLSRNMPSTVTLKVYFLGPIAGKTPLWIRMARLRFSHIAFALGNKLWDQPFNDYCHVYDEADWLAKKRLADDREHAVFTVTGRMDWWSVNDTLRELEGVRSIPFLIALRWLVLWPAPVRNCVTPVRMMLNNMGLDMRRSYALEKEETPDGIYKALRQAAQGFGHALYRLDTCVTQVAGGSIRPDPSPD